MAEEWESKIAKQLPENAYRELKAGEKYVPMVPPEVQAPELTTRSIIFGTQSRLWHAAMTSRRCSGRSSAVLLIIATSLLATGMILFRWG